MDQYELIRTAHRVYRKSIRQIARETGHTRRTVRKVLAGQEPQYRCENVPRRSVVAWSGAEMEFTLSQAVASGENWRYER